MDQPHKGGQAGVTKELRAQFHDDFGECADGLRDLVPLQRRAGGYPTASKAGKLQLPEFDRTTTFLLGGVAQLRFVAGGAVYFC